MTTTEFLEYNKYLDFEFKFLTGFLDKLNEDMSIQTKKLYYYAFDKFFFLLVKD